MEVIKKIIFILIVLFYGCKNTSKREELKINSIEVKSFKKDSTKNVAIKSDTTNFSSKKPKSIIKDDLYCFVKEIEIKHTEGEDLFVYKDFSLELTNCEMAICDLNYKDKNKNVFYHLTNDFDVGELNILIYKLNNQHIYILELDDYYSSIFYIYIYIYANQELKTEKKQV